MGIISHLPDEILSEIFTQLVYSPHKSSQREYMFRRISAIYLRIRLLVKVCPAWRRLVLACPNLWIVVPIMDSVCPHIPPIDVILQRAGSKSLHSVLLVDKLSCEMFENLLGHWHRFGVINLCFDSFTGNGITEVLGKVLEYSSPKSISKLSVRKAFAGWSTSPSHTIYFDPLIPKFAGSLSVFRISNINVKWEYIMFSHRLVELRVAQVMLRSDSEARGLFAALSSARELKELKLIAILFDPKVLNTNVPLEIVSLPKLEFLYLERCYFNILDFILAHITRGPYHLTLNMHLEDIHNYPFELLTGIPDPNLVHAFLRSVPIHKLILQGYGDSFWELGAGLRCIFESTPSLKMLVLNNYIINSDLLMAFKQPTASVPPTDTFPKLTRLEFHSASLAESLDGLKSGFEVVFNSHQIQTMVLGAIPKGTLAPPEESHEVVGWMRSKVPQFSLSLQPRETPKSVDIWQLWDA